jgi:hypothetical protein
MYVPLGLYMRPMGLVCPLGAHLCPLGLCYALWASSAHPPPLCVCALASFRPLEAHICPLGVHLCPLGVKCAPPPRRACPSPAPSVLIDLLEVLPWKSTSPLPMPC